MISFGDFRLDRHTRRLRHRGSERPLRAKSSAVLLNLAEHPDRLVTHGELLRAAWIGSSPRPVSAWPGTVVSQTEARGQTDLIRILFAGPSALLLESPR